INHLSGTFKINTTAGEVIFNGQNASVYFNRLFQQPFQLQDYTAHMQWIHLADGWRAQLSHLRITAPGLKVQAGMKMYMPASKQPYVQLLAGFYSNNVKEIRYYLPVGIFSKTLNTWLNQAFVGGKSVQGQVLLQGPLQHFPFDDHTGRFEISAKTNQIDFRYG